MCLAVPLKIVEIDGLDAVGEVEGQRPERGVEGFAQLPELIPAAGDAPDFVDPPVFEDPQPVDPPDKFGPQPARRAGNNDNPHQNPSCYRQFSLSGRHYAAIFSSRCTSRPAVPAGNRKAG